VSALLYERVFMSKKRAVVSLEDFIRVVITQRDAYPTHEKAAEALGMTVASFKQRLTKERKRYERVFEGVGRYQGVSNGPRIASEDEAMAILERLQTQGN
jgi:soluble P-type ATPase